MRRRRIKQQQLKHAHVTFHLHLVGRRTEYHRTGPTSGCRTQSSTTVSSAIRITYDIAARRRRRGIRDGEEASTCVLSSLTTRNLDPTRHAAITCHRHIMDCVVWFGRTCARQSTAARLTLISRVRPARPGDCRNSDFITFCYQRNSPYRRHQHNCATKTFLVLCRCFTLALLNYYASSPVSGCLVLDSNWKNAATIMSFDSNRQCLARLLNLY